MSESLAERLSRFTPDGGGLDRDALLFAAGRASAQPRRCWPALTGVLAASQLLTLLLLWPRTPPAAPFVAHSPAVAAESPAPSMPPDPSSWQALRGRISTLEGELPTPAGEDSFVPAEPPLHAFAVPPATLLN